jgi:ABC-type lipoprotein export system ATPase subunit
MFLEIKGIRKSFGTGDSRVDVLKGLNLEIEKGEFCVLLGPSGSGKSTLLNIIGGIDVADEGSIIIEGEQLEDMTEKKLSLYRRKHLGYIFQMYNLIPNLTVRENIEVGAQAINEQRAGEECCAVIEDASEEAEEDAEETCDSTEEPCEEAAEECSEKAEGSEAE